MLNESKSELVQAREYVERKKYINAFIQNKLDITELVEIINKNNNYIYHNDLSNLNYPAIYNVGEQNKVNNLFTDLFNLNMSIEEKIYIYMNSRFRTFVTFEDFVNTAIGNIKEKIDLFKYFSLYKFFGTVISISNENIEISPKYVGFGDTVVIKKCLEPDLEWKKVRVNDEVNFDIKEMLGGRVYGKTIKLKNNNIDEKDLEIWERYWKALLEISLNKRINDYNRTTLINMKNIDFRAIMKIAKNQELILECLKSFNSTTDIVDFLLLLGDRNSFKYDEVRTKLCYKPNGKFNEEKIEKLLEKVVYDRSSFKDKVFIYMNTPIKTSICIDRYISLLIKNGLEESEVGKIFEEYKFYGKVIYSTGNTIKFKPLTFLTKDIITVDKKSQPAIRKENININNVIIYKIKKFYKESNSFNIQAIAQLERK